MPITAITFGVKPDGKTVLLAGVETPISTQARQFVGYKSGQFPEGFTRVEMWDTDRGRVRMAVAPRLPQVVDSTPLKGEGVQTTVEDSQNARVETPANPATSGVEEVSASAPISPEPPQAPESDFVSESPAIAQPEKPKAAAASKKKAAAAPTRAKKTKSE